MKYLRFLFCGAALLLLPFISVQAQSWNVEQVGSLYNLWDACTDVAVQGDYAYLANYGSGLCVVDISEPGTPRIVGNLDFDGKVDVISVDGDYACLRAIGFGFHLVDITDPEQPVVLCSVPTSYSQDVDLDGQYLYVADCNDGLLIFDISDPTLPVRTGRLDLPQFTRKVVVSGDYAYVGNDRRGLIAVDVSDPSAPAATGLVHIGGVTFTDLEYDNGVVYALASYVVHTIDVNIPYWPVETCTNTLVGPVNGLAKSGNFLYAAAGPQGYHLLDAYNPYQPSYITTHDTPGYGYDVYALGNIMYLADSGSLRIYQIDNPQTPIELGFVDANGYLRAAEKDGDLVYLGDYDNGLRIVDVADPTSPMEVSTCFNSFTEHCYNLAVTDSFAYLACFDNGFTIVDITDPLAPIVISNLPLPGYVSNLDIEGNLAYLANRAHGLRIVDISDPYNPVEVALYDTYDWATTVAVSGDYAYVGEWSFIEIINISDPTQPFFVSRITLWDGIQRQVAVQGNYAYFIGSETIMEIVDITDPYQPEIVFEREGDHEYSAWDIVVQGDYALVSTNFAGLLVLNISDPSRPSMTGYHELPSGSLGLAAEDGLAYLADEFHFDIFDYTEAMIPFIDSAADGIDTAYKVSVPEVMVGPNPFNPSTVIRFTLQDASQVNLTVYDITGRQIAELVDGWRDAGVHEVTFDGTGLASGMYFYRLTVSGSGTPKGQATPTTWNGKMLLVK